MDVIFLISALGNVILTLLYQETKKDRDHQRYCRESYERLYRSADDRAEKYFKLLNPHRRDIVADPELEVHLEHMRNELDD